MTDITTATVATPEVMLWDVPPDPQMGLQPRGEVIFQGNATIPALGTNDESNWTLQMQLPKNFAFRIVEARVQQFSGSDNDVIDPDAGMRVIVDSDAPRFQQWNFGLSRQIFEDDSTSPVVSARFTFTSASAPEHVSFWNCPYSIDSFIPPTSGTARLFLNWINDGDGAPNGEYLMFFRFRCLMYDQNQLFRFPVHSPVPTIGP